MMKKFQPTQWIATAAVLAACMAVATKTRAEEAQIGARALTHQEIHDWHLPEGTQPSGGLFTVGVGQPAYLELQVPKGMVVSNVVWTISGKPAGSQVDYLPSPLPPAMPIYAPGDRELHDLADRKLLVPDVTGRYTNVVTAVNVADGAVVSAMQYVTAANYVGVGAYATDVVFPQCVVCHSGPWIRPDTVTPWSQTDHASFFTRAIDGLASSHYGESCIQCHVLGYDTTPGATNGGFDDVAAMLGWTFPSVLQPGNWEAMPDALKQVSNIQCESCHGPGSEHGWSGGNPELISVSYSSGDCAQCHDEQPYHVKNLEWNNSRHAIATQRPTGEGRSGCVGCHSAYGFVDATRGVPTAERRLDYEAITCAACHDPHDATNPSQLRVMADVALMDNITTVTNGGKGKLCMNCHMARRDAVSYVETASPSAHFGPHYGPQTDMLAGVNAVTYGKTIPSSGHIYAIKDSCVACHLQETARTDPAHLQAGGHTFKPAWDGGTPEDHSDDVHLVGACIGCHGPIQSFNLARHDYDEDGVVEGVQTEVEGLLHDLAMLLPPLGQPDVAISSAYTRPQLRAYYNWEFVEADGSLGIHNTAYTVGILKASIADLQAAGGPDTDQDGLPDEWEMTYFGSLTAQTGEGDADGDNLSNAWEWAMGTNPNLVDTDGDGYNDNIEVISGNDPVNPNDNPSLKVHIYSAAEFEFGTAADKTYQIQAVSQVSGGWQNVGEPIVGTGDMVQRFISTRSDYQQYYRVVELP